jgi:hypothetical protein
MRKGITTSVFILLLSIVSSSAFAEEKEYFTCDDFKKDPIYKGAFGLCNAYDKADDEDKMDIFRNWEKKFGTDGPRLPGHPYEDIVELACPCWADFTDADICMMGEAYYTSYGEGGLLEVDDFGTYPEVSNWFVAMGDFCAHSLFVQDQKPVENPIFGLEPDVAAQCISEVEAMGADGFCP